MHGSSDKDLADQQTKAIEEILDSFRSTKKKESWSRQKLNELVENWLPVIAIGLLSVLLAVTFFSISHFKLTKALELSGTLWILTGTIWGFLGVYMGNNKTDEIRDLRHMADDINKRPTAAKDLTHVQVFIKLFSKNDSILLHNAVTASNFAIIASLIILVGAIMLIIKITVAD